jgi:hypothetical protein
MRVAFYYTHRLAQVAIAGFISMNLKTKQPLDLFLS